MDAISLTREAKNLTMKAESLTTEAVSNCRKIWPRTINIYIVTGKMEIFTLKMENRWGLIYNKSYDVPLYFGGLVPWWLFLNWKKYFFNKGDFKWQFR